MSSKRLAKNQKSVRRRGGAHKDTGQQPRRRAAVIKMLTDTRHRFTAAETGMRKWPGRAPRSQQGPEAPWLWPHVPPFHLQSGGSLSREVSRVARITL